ncbi:ABC transporter substrate-binding protein [Euzebya sp.]|uniref:ABC transporter substrate-binding protein n=1 Tax=Euzebya sp. TaxID=1971409 RepID=UPI0035118BB4
MRTNRVLRRAAAALAAVTLLATGCAGSDSGDDEETADGATEVEEAAGDTATEDAAPDADGTEDAPAETGAEEPAAADDSSTADLSGETVTLAVLAALTGPTATVFGEPSEAGARAAIDYLESEGLAAGGVSYELEVRDSAEDPATVVSQARELTNDESLVAILSPSTSESALAMQPVLNEAGVLGFTTAATPELWDNACADCEYPWMFHAYEYGQVTVRPHLEWLVAQADPGTTVALAYPLSGYGESQAEATEAAAEEMGVDLVSMSFQPGAPDLSAQLRQLRQDAGDTDLLLTWAAYGDAVQLVNGLRQIDWTPHVAGPLGMVEAPVLEALGEENLDRLAAGVVPNTMLVDAEGDEPEGLAVEFWTRFAEETGAAQAGTASFVGAAAFDMVLVVNAAIEQAGSTDPAAIREVLDAGLTVDASRGAYEYSADDRLGQEDAADFGMMAAQYSCETGACVAVGTGG